MTQSSETGSRLHRWLSRHVVACFVLMTVSFVLFGVLSLDLVRLVAANASFIAENGWQALADDGLVQMLQLWGGALIAIGAYLLFKVCEHVLVAALSQARQR